MPVPRFNSGDRFTNKCNGKSGVVRRLRDDSWEQKNNWPNGRFYYHVDYDDGSFETYESESFMDKI